MQSKRVSSLASRSSSPRKECHGFRYLTRVWYEEDSPPSCSVSRFQCTLQRGGSIEPIFSPLPSGNRGKECLLDSRSVRAHPCIPEAFQNAAGRPTQTPVEKPWLRQIRAGSAGQATWRFAPPQSQSMSAYARASHGKPSVTLLSRFASWSAVIRTSARIAARFRPQVSESWGHESRGPSQARLDSRP